MEKKDGIKEFFFFKKQSLLYQVILYTIRSVPLMNIQAHCTHNVILRSMNLGIIENFKIYFKILSSFFQNWIIFDKFEVIENDITAARKKCLETRKNSVLRTKK